MPPSKIQFAYVSSRYRSLARAAREYRNLLEEDFQLTRDIDAADIVFLHVDPSHWGRLFQLFPSLSEKFIVGCCVWETDRLPESYIQSIHLATAVWVPSEYCRQSFSRYHDNVQILPHIAEPGIAPSVESRVRLRKTLKASESDIVFMASAQMWDKRKGLHTLVQMFESISARIPHARLVVKTMGAADLPLINHISWWDEVVSDDMMGALYDAVDVVVSCHHSEGWGYILSDALAKGRPVIATGYSGNLDFMQDTCCVSVDAKEDWIRPELTMWNYTTEMKWGYPDQEQFKNAMMRVYSRFLDGKDEQRQVYELQARKAMRRFDRSQIQARIRQLSRVFF